MNQISKRLIIIAVFLFINIIPVAVLATNENIAIVSNLNKQTRKEYIIYIKDYTDKNFKYAYTTNANPEEMDLSYINSISDLEQNQVAFLSVETYEKLLNEGSKIYMWAKDEKGLILEGIQLDLSESLSEEKIEISETLTNRIKVEIAENEEDTTTIRNENIEGVEETASVGYVKIVDDQKSTYYYERTKLPSSEEYNQLMVLAEKIRDEYNEMDMYEKIQFGAKFNELYSKIMSEAKWQELEGTVIEQPEESVADDQYIVLLKKVDNQGKTTMDVQFLTAFDSYRPNVIKEEVIIEETTKLPITYDSSILLVILGVVIMLILLISIRMKKIKDK